MGADVNHTRGRWAGWEEQSGVTRSHGCFPGRTQCCSLRTVTFLLIMLVWVLFGEETWTPGRTLHAAAAARSRAVPHASTPIVMTGLMSCPSTHTPTEPHLVGSCRAVSFQREKILELWSKGPRLLSRGLGTRPDPLPGSASAVLSTQGPPRLLGELTWSTVHSDALLPPPWMGCVPGLWGQLPPALPKPLQLCQGALGSPGGALLLLCMGMDGQPSLAPPPSSGLWWLFPQPWLPEPEKRDARGQGSGGRVSGVKAGSRCLTASGTGCVPGGSGGCFTGWPRTWADASVI